MWGEGKGRCGGVKKCGDRSREVCWDVGECME